KALNQMDEVTQQNSALVEENAATAKTLETQAQAMSERISFFHIGQAEGHAAPGGRSAPAPKPQIAARRPAASMKAPPTKRTATGANRGPVGQMQKALARAIEEDPEKEF